MWSVVEPFARHTCPETALDAQPLDAPHHPCWQRAQAVAEMSREGTVTSVTSQTLPTIPSNPNLEYMAAPRHGKRPTWHVPAWVRSDPGHQLPLFSPKSTGGDAPALEETLVHGMYMACTKIFKAWAFGHPESPRYEAFFR